MTSSASPAPAPAPAPAIFVVAAEKASDGGSLLTSRGSGNVLLAPAVPHLCYNKCFRLLSEGPVHARLDALSTKTLHGRSCPVMSCSLHAALLRVLAQGASLTGARLTPAGTSLTH